MKWRTCGESAEGMQTSSIQSVKGRSSSTEHIGVRVQYGRNQSKWKKRKL